MAAVVRRSLLAAAIGAGLLAVSPAPASAWDDAGYWAFADKVQSRLDDTWSPRLGQYRTGSPSVDKSPGSSSPPSRLPRPTRVPR